MVIQLNGQPRELAPSTTVAELVRSLGLVAEQVAVERNGRLVRRAEHGTLRLAAGDALEIVTLVGGG
ncbi:MAG: sulfur carrier protein ThiS [Planctomycetes bacterium]|nr:sulfur carrier protein ThiS [Planctomycetota bacterium]